LFIELHACGFNGLLFRKRRRKMKILGITCLFATFGLIGIQAMGSPPDKNDFKIYLESLSSVDGVLFPMALNGASTEALSAVRTKLLATHAPFPHLSLKGNEISSDGRATGITVFSMKPFSLKYKGAVWTSDKNLPADENFARLLKTLKVSSLQTSLISIVDSAYAADLSETDRVVAAGGAAGWNECLGFENAYAEAIGPGIVLTPLTCGLMAGAAKISHARITCGADGKASFSWAAAGKRTHEPYLKDLCPRSAKTEKFEQKMTEAAHAVTDFPAPNNNFQERGNDKGAGAGM
jgi:hypothetical protein